MWRGHRRTIVRYLPATHGRHAYYGIRVKKSVGRSLPPSFTNTAVDGRRGRADTMMYYIRSDRLPRFDGGAERTGVSGRPRLQSRVGPKRTKAMSECRFCGTPISLGARACRADQWRLSPRRICPRCGGKKETRSEKCNTCQHKDQLSPVTMSIIEVLMSLGRPLPYGTYAILARRYGLSRARIQQIDTAHVKPKLSPSPK